MRQEENREHATRQNRKLKSNVHRSDPCETGAFSVSPEMLERLQSQLAVRFKDVTRLARALTHRSMAVESPLDSNERLEFLGDSVVGLVVSDYLFRSYPIYSEGDLAKSKAYIVSEAALAEAARDMGMEEYVQLSSGEAASGGRKRRSILADTFEAVIGAIYLDCGIVAARRVVRQALNRALLKVLEDRHRGDYKSSLQEQTQAVERVTPIYRILQETGQEHDKTFIAQALIENRVIGEGRGKSKKEAEQAAAQNALQNRTAEVVDRSDAN